MSRRSSDVVTLAIGLGAVAGVTFLYVAWLGVSNAAIVSTTFLMVVLLVAATARLWVAAVISVVSMLSFNFFFLPPVGTWTIADPQNWVALGAFFGVSLVASHLSAAARARTREARDRRDELARLYDLGRDVLGVTDSRGALAILARAVARRFDLDFVALALPHGDDWEVFDAGQRTAALDRAQLTAAYASAQTALEFDAHARTYAGHRTIAVEGRAVRLVPLRVGTKPIGLLVAAGRPIEAGTLDALAGLVAMAIERAQFLEERREATLTRQSEALKTALLASLGHDLRTPLTAIRVAASNLQGALNDQGRREQSDLIAAEAEKLSRLFENILEMARLDAGAIAADARWTHPSEIVAAARDQVDRTLRGHTVSVTTDRDVPVLLDPRLIASALARLLENAAQYAPAGSAVEIRTSVTGEGLTIQVRDHGPGITPADLPHLFERFYRGAAARPRTSGTGMGLSIARGLLTVAGGRIWAENAPDGGTQFTIVVPADVRKTEPSASPAA